LWDWLPHHSLWGKTSRAQWGERDRLRGVLFDLVRPGSVDDAPRVPDDLARQMGEEAQSFLETAYWFPVQAHVGHRSGLSTKDIVPNRLRLDIAYGFLPSVGTLIFDAVINPRRPKMRSVPVNVVVHYAEVDGRLRYRVCRDGELLDVPRNAPFTQWVQGEEWPAGKTRAVRLPDGRGGEAKQFSVYLGDWRVRDRSVEKEAVGARPDNTRVNWRADLASDLARGDHAPIHPLAFLDRSDSLRRVLGSGKFQFSGRIYFYPLRPFNPQAAVPDTPPRFAADQDFDFTYPQSE
jgi:hypothetical protein